MNQALARMTERAWMRQVIDLAQLHGYLVYHTHDSRRSAAGFPDLLMVRRGRLLAIECKSERGRVTPEQMAWIELLDTVPGVTAMVARPRDFDVVRAVVQARSERTMP